MPRAWPGGRPPPQALLAVGNILAALKDQLSRELCRKAGSKQLKYFTLRLVDKALILSSSVSLVPFYVFCFFNSTLAFFRFSSYTRQL